MKGTKCHTPTSLWGVIKKMKIKLSVEYDPVDDSIKVCSNKQTGKAKTLETLNAEQCR